MSQKNEVCVLGAGKSLAVTTWNNQRVVTASTIDELHGRISGTARDAFRRNKKHFVEGEDYFLLKGEDLDKFKQQNGSGFNTPPNKRGGARAVTVFTQTGYLMLTKPMNDNVSWMIQRMLVNKYFQPPIALQNPFSVLRQVAEKMEVMYSTMMSAADYDNLVEAQDDINVGFENRLKALESAKLVPTDEVMAMVGTEQVKLLKSQYEAMQVDMTNMKMELAKLKTLQQQAKEKPRKVEKIEKESASEKPNDYYKVLTQEGRTFKALAARMGLYSMYGEPHHKFVAAIAKELSYHPGDGFMTEPKTFLSHKAGVKDFLVTYLTVAGMQGIVEHFKRIENEYGVIVRKGKPYRAYELDGKKFYIEYRAAKKEQVELAG